MISVGEIAFPFDFDMMSPFSSHTMPWWYRWTTGSSVGTQPASKSTFAMNLK